MKITFGFLYLAMFPVTFSANQLLPDTILLSESLSTFDQCTFIIFTSKLDKTSSTQIRDTFYEVETLKVSQIHFVKVSDLKLSNLPIG